jgi:hypothetical protein
VTVPAFLPGLGLAEAFFAEAVKPLLDAEFPGLPCAAALIGQGSEVLGFDDATSSDHHWGPRVLLFLPEDVLAQRGEAIDRALREKLPVRFRGWPTNFDEPRPGEITRMLAPIERGPVNHRVELLSVPGFFRRQLAWDPANELDAADWLTFPQQALLEVTSGRVFCDEIGLEDVRARLRWYPRDVWLYLLACGWRRIAQEEHLAPRAAQVGDELGSRLIAARLVRDVMRLGFLLERRYAPYPKWLGTAFRTLACASALTPALERVLAADAWPAREAALCEAYRLVAELQNASALADPVPPEPAPFWDRPFRVIHGDRFAAALCRRVSDPAVRALVTRPLIGSLDLFGDSTDLAHPRWRRRLRELYR